MPKSKPLKLIIDTNLWISFIISGKYNYLDPLLINKQARLLFSTELITEIHENIRKPGLSKYFGTHALEEMFSAFEPFTDLIDVRSNVTAETLKIISCWRWRKMVKPTTCLRVTKTCLIW